MEHDDEPSNQRTAAPFREDGTVERFILTSRTRDEGKSYNDARETGAAFFAADPAERPSVIHAWGNQARTMARTEIHGVHEDGEPRYHKALPALHAPDAEFRAGYLDAMERSLEDRLGKIAWADGEPGKTSRLAPRLKDDLEQFARHEPDRAAGLWSDHTSDPAPGPHLQAAVQAREATADRDLAAYYDAVVEKPPVIATGDWVTTDRDVDLRPIAVATDRGVHSGYEAALPDGRSELTFSERSFENSREALKHSWDFYEGGEEGLEVAVSQRTAIERDRSIEEDAAPKGIALELRAQSEFARPETAIYAGEDAQLLLTFGADNDRSRDLAEKLVANTDFRKLVEAHIPDAQTTLGTGRFQDGQSSIFLPDEALTVTAPDRNGDREILVKFPNQDSLSLALASQLLDSPVLAQHGQSEQVRPDPWANPDKTISSWIEASNEQIDRLPVETRQELRTEMYDIATEAASAFGLERERQAIAAEPKSALYGTALGAYPQVDTTDQMTLSFATQEHLKNSLSDAAKEVGLDAGTIGQRLDVGAANAHQEESWVKSDLAQVAARHGFDLGDPSSAGRAAEIVDRFYKKAARILNAAHVVEDAREPEPLVKALQTMAEVQASQGTVAFRNEGQARDFAEEMKERYGETILKDMAAGRTEALAGDVPDAAARQAMAQAVVAAAKEHPSLGLTAHEAEAAERSFAAQARERERPSDHVRERDREF